METPLKHTPLRAWHVEHGAKMVPFAGWEMPIQYAGGALQEHRLVRTSAGIFDISHMGQLELRGPDAPAFLDYLLTSSMSTLEAGNSRYGLICDTDGGVLDDLFVYRLQDKWWIVINAANTESDYQWFRQHASEYEVELANVSDSTAMFAVQGPAAIEIMDDVSGGRVSAIPRFGAADCSIVGVNCLVGRTGYTGEDGVELFLSTAEAQTVWAAILDSEVARRADLSPVGLAARDSLRFEPGFPLYGHEISREVTPVEARLTWACDFDSNFIGRDAIFARKETGPAQRLCTFTLTERGVPRQDCEIFAPAGEAAGSDGRRIGTVVTGMFAPSAEVYAGNAFVETAYSKVGAEFEVDIRGRRKAAVVVKRPLYKPAYK